MVKDTRPGDLRMIRMVFERLGLRSELRGAEVIVPANQKLVIRNDAGDYMPKVEDGPWPSYPADLMGAAITICDPHRAIVVGPRRLRGQRVDSPDIRAGMAMLIAALCADGVTEIGNVSHIDRG